MEFISPKTLQDMLVIKQKTGYPILAGGTDLIVQWRAQNRRPKGVISISNILELKKIEEDDDFIYIGTLATHTEIINSPLIKKHLPALSKACALIGASQIQNRGTIGGNVMNASPAGDTLPVLLVYDAGAIASSVNGNRRIPFTRFYKGYRKTGLLKNEILTRFVIKKPLRGERADFLKIGTRSAQAISKICACFRIISPLNKGEAGGIRIAYGSVAPVPIRCVKTEKYLTGNRLNKKIINKAVELLKEDIAPIDDIRSTLGYRLRTAQVLLERFLTLNPSCTA